jgi:adenine-specific DNA-methyltransferase
VSTTSTIQSPFTGEFHYPGERHWANKRSTMQAWLEGWNVKYSSVDLDDGEAKALCIRGWKPGATKNEQLLEQARTAALSKLKQGNWPFLYWGLDGLQKPVKKSHKCLIKQGAVPQSFWLEDDEGPTAIDDVSWLRAMSGRSRDGVEELDAIVGRGHSFETVKPLKLFRKIIQIWCPHNGLVLDPFAGSGTTIVEANAFGARAGS